MRIYAISVHLTDCEVFMNTAERQAGRIHAVISAAEEVISRAKPLGDRETVMMAKETAYDHIKGIMEDPGWCPWQE